MPKKLILNPDATASNVIYLRGPSYLRCEGEVDNTVQLQSCLTQDFSTEIQVEYTFASNDRSIKLDGVEDLYWRVVAPNGGVTAYRHLRMNSRDGGSS